MINTKRSLHSLPLLASIGLSAIAPGTASAETGVRPSSASAYFDSIRQHANQRLEDRDRLRSELDSSRRAPGMQADTHIDQGVRDAAYEDALADAGILPEPSANSIYDEIYNRNLTSRYTAFSRSDYVGVVDHRYGRADSVYSYSMPDRTSFYPEPVRSENRNFNLGPVDVRFGVNTFAEYNDNILTSSTNKIEDVVIGTLIDLGGSWQLTDNNRIDLSLGIGIERYLDHQDEIATSNDDFNLIITPDSSLSFDIFIGEILLNLHDRFSVQNRGRDEFVLDDLEIFSQWTNEVGASLYIPINNELDLSLGYDYATTRSLEDRNKYLDRNSHQLFASTSYSPGQTWRFGFQTTASFTSYVEPIQDDVDSYNFGLFYETPLSQFTDIRLDGGYQMMDFADSGAGGAPQDQGDFYGSIAINNQLNDYFNHSISIGHESTLGVLSNYTVVDYARYSFRLDTKRDQSIGGSIFYEMEEETGGTLPVDSDRFGTSLNYNMLLTKDLSLAVGGSYGIVDSDSNLLDYDRWGASIDLQYALSQDLALGLRYAYSTVSSDTGSQNYSQNRVILNLNYQF